MQRPQVSQHRKEGNPAGAGNSEFDMARALTGSNGHLGLRDPAPALPAPWTDTHKRAACISGQPLPYNMRPVAPPSRTVYQSAALIWHGITDSNRFYQFWRLTC